MTIEKTTDQKKAKSLREIFSSYFNFLSLPDETSQQGKRQPVRKPEHSTSLTFLKPIPWILGLLFAFSFIWDFQNVAVSIGTLQLNFQGLLRILSISGLIGFLTNRIAIMMLFRPMKKRPLLGHGLIPAHKERIARRLAISVSDDLINPELIQKKLEQSGAISRYRNQMVGTISDVLLNPEFRTDFKLWLSTALNGLISDHDFRQRLAGGIAAEVERSAPDNSIEKAAFKAYMYLRGQHIHDLVDNALLRLPEKLEQEMTLVDSYLDDLPNLIEKSSDSIDRFAALLLERLIRQLNVEKIVEENLRNYDEEKLEKMIKGATNEQLNTIQYLGAVLGTVGGFVIWEPLLSLIIIGTLFGFIYILDRILG